MTCNVYLSFRAKIKILSLSILFVLAGALLNVQAAEVSGSLKLVSDLDQAPKPSSSEARVSFKVEGSHLTADVVTSGGCADHTFDLYVSQKLRESFPPIVSGHLVHDDNGDTCKGIISGKLKYDLASTPFSVGPHIIEIVTSPGQAASLLFDLSNVESAPDLASSQINIGKPTDLGGSIRSIRDASIVSGSGKDWLQLERLYGGGCSEHNFTIWWDKTLKDTAPPSLDLVLVDDNKGDRCKAIKVRNTLYDISSLNLPSGKYSIRVNARGIHSEIVNYER